MTAAPDSAESLLARLQSDEIEYLWVTYHDYSGVACAKTVPSREFASVVSEGVVFAKANLDMDILDVQPDTATMLADSGDFLAVPDPRSYARLPGYRHTARAHAWMRDSDGSDWQGCPRTRLESVVGELADQGITIQCAFEPEFYLLARSENGECLPTNQSRMFTQAGLQQESGFVESLLTNMQDLGIRVPQLGKEYGLGQYEMSVHHAPPVKAVDDYWHLKEAVRDTARSFGHVATFMPKPHEDWAGCSLHVHISLWDVDGHMNLAASSDDDVSLSDQGKWFMGGLIAHAPALTGLGSPTVNSYKRLLPGSWAPANTYWGYGNRSGVVRVPGAGNRRRIEYRSGDNSCNPALFLTGLLAAGLDGLHQRIDPGPPFQGDVGHLSAEQIAASDLTFLPRNLDHALSALESDDVIADALGSEILAHFLSIKRSELNAYSLTVHPWERDTYLEVI